FAGSIDEVAVYKTALDATAVATHYAAATGNEPPNVAPVAAFEHQTDGLGVSVDGSASSDPDGTVTSYEWDFGDGGSATGVQAAHTYEEPGVYEITLTVTDDDGATRSVTQEVAVTTPPVADFTATLDGARLDVDASASTDDEEIVSYRWDFGDSGTATGVTASHTYTGGGTFDVTLTVTDNRGETGSVTREVTVVAPNVAPVAVFSMVPDGLSVEVDGSGSSDADGTVTSYAWDFGDGGGASGVTASHTYGEAGTYEATLTVAADAGAAASLTPEVSVSAEVRPVAVDAFGRSVSDGWGSADVGGVWTRSGTASNFSVVDGVGRIRMGSPG